MKRDRDEVLSDIQFSQQTQADEAQARQKENVSGITRIGARDGQTGRWQAITASSDRPNGVKTFNTSVPSGSLVRGVPMPGGMTALDRENTIPSPTPPEPTISPSWAIAWVYQVQTFEEISTGDEGFGVILSETYTVFLQVKGKERLALFADTGTIGGAWGGAQETIEVRLLGLHSITPNELIVEVYFDRKGFDQFPGLDNPGTPNRRFTAALRYRVRNGVAIEQLESYSIINFEFSDEPAALPNNSGGYGAYFNNDPFSITDFAYAPEGAIASNLEQMIYPKPSRYHRSFGKRQFYQGGYSLLSRGLAREVSDRSETIKGADRAAKFYGYSIKVSPSDLDNYIAQTTGNEKPFWQEVLALYGGKVTGQMGQWVRTGTQPRQIAPSRIASPPDSRGLIWLGNRQANAIIEVYELSESIPATYAGDGVKLPFWAIPSFARVVGQVSIQFDDPTLITVERLVTGLFSGFDFVFFNRPTDAMLKILI